VKKNELVPFSRLHINSHTGFSGSKARKVPCLCRLYQNIKLGAVRRKRRGHHYVAEHGEEKRRNNQTFDE
jgi:hypothetical protein